MEEKHIMYKNSNFEAVLTVLMAILASKLSTQLKTKSTDFPSSSPPCLRRHNNLFQRPGPVGREGSKGETYPPDALHKMCKIFQCGNIVVVGLK